VTTPDDALIDDLYNLGFLLGIKPLDIKTAVEAVDDKRDLLCRWKRTYRNAERRISAADERRWANENAEEANERHTELQREQAESRRAARERMTLGQRIDALRAETVLEPGPGVAALGSTKVLGGEGDQAPPDPGEFVTMFEMRVGGGKDWTLRTHWRFVENYITSLEGEWDEFMGHGAAKNWWLASTEEKNRELLARYVGMHSREVAKVAPWFGNERAITRIRSEAKLKPTTGEPK
jgi:hypothetical protein